MVEDMYKEEFRDVEVNGKSSPEETRKAAVDQTSSSDDKEKIIHRHMSSLVEHDTSFMNDMEVNGYAGQRHMDLADQYRFDDPQLLHDFVV